MARNLSDLTITAPASDSNPAVGGSFTFTVTPSFGGVGVINAYQGTGSYVSLAGTGSLSTASTNPVTAHCGLAYREVKPGTWERMALPQAKEPETR